MIVAGLDTIPYAVKGVPPFAKFILNETAIVFFRSMVQHREVKQHGLSYEDNYRGNCVAGSFVEDRIDIRWHKEFSDERIRNLWMQVLAEPTLSFLRDRPLFYKNRLIA